LALGKLAECETALVASQNVGSQSDLMRHPGSQQHLTCCAIADAAFEFKKGFST
jgi:hypothetical protein